MTAAEAYELITGGGAGDFQRLIRACEAHGPYCLIGGLADNCYVEPVYTLDTDIVVVARGFLRLPRISKLAPGSDLRIQFTTDGRYQAFPARAVEAFAPGSPVSRT